jgi:hypothetical protein
MSLAELLAIVAGVVIFSAAFTYTLFALSMRSVRKRRAARLAQGDPRDRPGP